MEIIKKTYPKKGASKNNKQDKYLKKTFPDMNKTTDKSKIKIGI